MRQPLVAGNWKMYKTVAEARILIAELLPILSTIQEIEIVLCPPYTSILSVAALLEGTNIHTGAQNMHWEPSGAYTGEIAAPMLAEFCKYVILGHSERRGYFGETDVTVNRKVKAAFEYGLAPILCVGETLAENEAGITEQVVVRQVKAGLEGVDPQSINSIVVAYEPVWAIGTGRAATAEGANAVIGRIIRGTLAELYGEELAQLVRILYGGSVKANNAGEFFQYADIDGALVGGASLKAPDFTSIVKAAAG
jgi:triosephosphate isomerase